MIWFLQKKNVENIQWEVRWNTLKQLCDKIPINVSIFCILHNVFILFQVNKVEGIFAEGYVSGFMFTR